MQTQAIRVITLVSIRFQPRPQCRVVLRHEVTGVERQPLVGKQLSAVYPRLRVANVLRLEGVLNPNLAGAYHGGLLHAVVGGHRPQCLSLLLLRPCRHGGEGKDEGDDFAHSLFLLILYLHVVPAVLGLLDFVLRRIAFVNDVHDFVDVLFGEVIAVKGRVVDEKGIAGVEETAQAATGLQPVPQVFEGPADACPQPVDGAEVDEQGETRERDDDETFRLSFLLFL